MILVDTSVWIEFLRGRHRLEAEMLPRIVICGPILQEVFAGLREGPSGEEFRNRMLALPRLCDPLPSRLFLDAAEIYNTGRRKGHTIRSGVDCLIAAVAIECGVAVMHKDRDFDVIARFTGLRVRR